MMENPYFVTETDEKYMRKITDKASVVVFGIFSILATLCLLVTWQMFVFLEVVVLISSVAGFIKNRKKSLSWKLEFRGDQLALTDLQTGEVYDVYNIPASDFVITQTGKEKEMDYCSLGIRKTIFALGGVKNATGLKEYIEKNYP